ncbi:hypothetical protein AVEN_166045-1 [Araneus ventricosus]|uniref:Uncharacterized protein n=1 Tax=Araneus ventricosus TaxID=182803 RepID=A0A4Y2RK38_ARAVE|nr:hypothetical protein AVEN_166045-1 [Araneus ventricosus]
MPLKNEERIYIYLLDWSGTTTHHVAPTFIATHRTQITHGTVAKLSRNSKGQVSSPMLADMEKIKGEVDGTSTLVLAAMARNATKGT